MTDVLEARSDRADADWHPSMGAPGGRRAAQAKQAARREQPKPKPRSGQPKPGWHPSQGSGQRTRAGRPHRRLSVLGIAAAIGLAALGARLVQVQVLERDTYAVLGERQGTAQWQIESVRGAILDRNLNLLAMSDSLPTVWADPRAVRNPHGTALALGAVLDIDADAVAQRLASDQHFVYVARQVTPDQGSAVAQLQLDGVHVRAEASRLRPNGNQFARGLLGVTDVDQNPLGGAEQQFAEVLDGTDGRAVARVAQSGMALPTGTRLFEPASHGDDVVLTLHTQVQWVAERALSEAVDTTDARGGMVVVMEVSSGDVLALASVVRDSASGRVRTTAHNPAYTDIFEPGSVAKSFTVATALQEGLTTPDEVHATPARYVFADKEFVEPYSGIDREMTSAEILIHSSNIGTIQVAERIGERTLYRSLRNFGFGRLSGPEGAQAFPGESRGILRPANEWHGADLATISFGHGIAVTAIQLAAGYNTIANDGVYVAPRLVLGSVGANGTLAPADAPETRQVLSADTAAVMQSILADVVAQGTGQRAAIDGFAVAGKTGTAQKPSPEGGYSTEDYTSTFAGFLPAHDAELTVVVVLDEPDENRAGIVAAPVFAEVGEYALRVLGVSPDA